MMLWELSDPLPLHNYVGRSSSSLARSLALSSPPPPRAHPGMMIRTLKRRPPAADGAWSATPPPPAAQRWARRPRQGEGMTCRGKSSPVRVRPPKCKCRLFTSLTLPTWRRNDYLPRRRSRRITRRRIGGRGREAAIHQRALDLEVCQVSKWKAHRFYEIHELK